VSSIISNLGKDVPYDYTIVLCGFGIEGCWTNLSGKAYVAYSQHQFIFDRRRIYSSFRMYDGVSQISFNKIPNIVFRVRLATEEKDIRGYGDGRVMFMSFLHDSPDHNQMILEQCAVEFLGKKKLGDICD